MESEQDEFVVTRLPDVLDSLAVILFPASAVAGLADLNAVHSPQGVLAQWFCCPSDPLAPVAAADGCQGEGKSQADGEEGQYPLPPRPVHGGMKFLVPARARTPSSLPLHSLHPPALPSGILTQLIHGPLGSPSLFQHTAFT